MINRSKTTEPQKSPESYVRRGRPSQSVLVGKYMKEMGIKAQWVKPWTITTIDSDFSNELQISWMNSLLLTAQMRYGAVILRISDDRCFVYLTSIMDLFSRKIIAWTLSQTLEVSCVINTINKRKPDGTQSCR